MNVVREINKINELELELGTKGASWHDEYKDSAYVFVGGLPYDLTEGDVITIFSQFGEVMDVNLPRNKETGKIKGFGFLMYEDQRSTILAVDNLNGATVLDRTLRVDHVKNYKQPKSKGEDGEWIEAEEQSLNAKPEMVMNDAGSESSASSAPDIDPDDPMRDYLLQKWKEERASKKPKKSKSKGKHKDESPEERRARKERKRERKTRRQAGKSEGLKGVEALLKSLDRRGGDDEGGGGGGMRSASPRQDSRRTPGRTPPREDRYSRRSRDYPRFRSPLRPASRSRSPPRRYSSRSGHKQYNDEDAREDKRYDRDSQSTRRAFN